MTSAQITSRPAVLFLSHGGGPLPLLGDAGHRELVANLQGIAARIAKPSALIVVSAHWEAEQATLIASSAPPLLYDYYGFPPASYEIQYPLKGSPELASRLQLLLRDKGLDAALEQHRGVDHGVFVPLKIMYPDADIPCVQLSLVRGLDPNLHIRMGEAIAELARDDILVIGSGFSFHNMKAFFTPAGAEEQKMNEDFEAWLIETCSSPISESARTARLENWADAPFASYCHPRQEHLLPLHVCYGVAQRPCKEVFEMQILGKKASAYLW